MAATIIPLSIDDSIASVENCTIACIATPWFLWVGFIFAFSALFSKLDRINKLINSAESFRRIRISAMDVMLPFLTLLALTLMFLLAWTVIDPMSWVRKDVFGSTDGLSTFGTCEIGQTNVSKVMLACLIVLAFACVIRASVSAWYGRSVSVEYSESRYVSVIVIGMLQAFPIGIPLLILSNSNPVTKYFVEVTLIFVLTLSILLLIFVPKILFLRKEQSSPPSSHSSTRVTGGYTPGIRVVGRNQLFRESTQVEPIGATGTVGGITTKQMEELQELLKETGTINDKTDIQSLVQSVGIVISDSFDVSSSRSRQSLNYQRTSLISNLSTVAMNGTIVEEHKKADADTSSE